MPKKEWWVEKFNQFNIKLTKSRKMIINIIQNSKEHLSAENIYFTIHKKGHSIGLTTIYRTLDLFSQIGIVQKFDFGDKKTRYELINSSDGKGHHHHLVCIICKNIIDYNDYEKEELELINKTEKLLSKKYNYKITDHFIEFHGYCEKCRVV